jgi:DNA invertase Pin-like site-specific DNA recombinase
MRDMVLKGRHRTNRGEAHYATKITDATASHIRKEYKEGIHSIEAIASKFNSSFSVVQRIIARKTWRHIP